MPEHGAENPASGCTVPAIRLGFVTSADVPITSARRSGRYRPDWLTCFARQAGTSSGAESFGEGCEVLGGHRVGFVHEHGHRELTPHQIRIQPEALFLRQEIRRHRNRETMGPVCRFRERLRA